MIKGKDDSMTQEEHEKWHKEHENDPEFWAKKYKKRKQKEVLKIRM